MALGYFIGIGGMPVEPTGAECYEQYPLMRRWCKQVESWTGVELRPILTENYAMPLISAILDALTTPIDLSVRPDFLYYGQIRLAAHVIGISDILAEEGIRPDLIVGTSIGGLIAACLAGSIDRKDLFELYARVAEMPLAPAGEQARGIAMVELPPGTDIDWYCGESRPHVSIAAEFENSGDSTIMMLSGYLKDLERMAAEAPPGHVQMVTGTTGGLHCPEQQFVVDLLEPHLNDINFRDPEIPLLCGVGGDQAKNAALLKTGDDVRRSVMENYVAPVGSFKQITAALDEHGMQMVLAPGVVLPPTLPTCPFPVLQVTVPDDIGQAMTMIYDLGIDVGR